MRELALLRSNIAMAAAGDALPATRAQLVDEVFDFLPDAEGDDFVHALKRGDGETCFECGGQRDGETWVGYVRLAVYRPTRPVAADHPDPELAGRVFFVPVPIENLNNGVFLEVGRLPIPLGAGPATRREDRANRSWPKSWPTRSP